MSFNDSFIKEISEEVRRDKFFKYLKKYAWIGILLILFSLFAVSFNEWKKNKEKINNQLNGDELSVVLDKFFEDKNYNDYFSYIEQKKSGSILAGLNPLFLNNNDDVGKKISYLKNISTDENIPLVLRDLALLYQYYLGNKPYTDKFKILTELSGPDRPFKLLAVEEKINLFLEKGSYKEALKEIDTIQPELSNSFSLNNRLNNLKNILENISE